MPSHSLEPSWTDRDVPVSERFGDPYYSLEDGLAETRHVFLAGNDLPGRYREGFLVAELGFGTGLNLLAAWNAWQTQCVPGPLRFVSFEASPLKKRDMMRAISAFPDIAPQAERFFAAWDGRSRLDRLERLELPDLEFELVLGDARETLPRWERRADAWFLDGFAPARNPEMWEPALMAAAFARTAPGGTAATYTAAGAPRRALEVAGFEVARVPGHGRKRHMTRATRIARTDGS